MNSNEASGFSLIEVAIVIIVIGILATIAVPTYLSLRSRAETASAQSAILTTGSGARLALIALGTNRYPGADQTIASLSTETPEVDIVPWADVLDADPGAVGVGPAQDGRVLQMRTQSLSGQWYCVYDITESFNWGDHDWQPGRYFLSGQDCDTAGWG